MRVRDKGGEGYVFGKKLGDQEFLLGVSLFSGFEGVVDFDFLVFVDVDVDEVDDDEAHVVEHVFDSENVLNSEDDEVADDHSESHVDREQEVHQARTFTQIFS